MPRIIALRRGAVASVDLGHYACQIEGGVTSMDLGEESPTPAFALLYRYPPGTTAAYRVDGAFWRAPLASHVLVEVPISLAETVAELERIVSVSMTGLGKERDQARMAEAFNMFRNRARDVSTARLEACVRDAAAVLSGFYDIRAWMQDGMREQKEIAVVTSYKQREGEVLEAKLVCQP